MKKVTFAIIGMGNRGSRYAYLQCKYPDDMQVVAIADTRSVRTKAAAEYLPGVKIFDSADTFLAQPKMADVV